MRFLEVRKIAKLSLKQLAQKNWFDAVITLDQLVSNFNLQVKSAIQLCIEDILNAFVQSKSAQTVQQMLAITSDSLTNRNTFPINALS